METAKKVTLKWSPLTKISSQNFLQFSQKTGVYIWGFRIDSQFIPYYVGVANDVQTRALEHLSNLISGKYAIIHKDHLKDFGSFSEAKKGHVILFMPDWPSNFPQFLARRKELEPHITFMLQNSEFSFAEYAAKAGWSPNLKEVEKFIISRIGKVNLANSRGGTSEITDLENLGEEKVRKILKTKS